MVSRHRPTSSGKFNSMASCTADLPAPASAADAASSTTSPPSCACGTSTASRSILSSAPLSACSALPSVSTRNCSRSSSSFCSESSAVTSMVWALDTARFSSSTRRRYSPSQRWTSSRAFITS